MPVSLSVLVPVYNERYLVESSLKRLFLIKSDLISNLEVIAVDDCSQDGSWEVLQKIARQDHRVRVLRHKKNQGKGAAIRTALQYANNDICIVHDADMEYNPQDIPALLLPFLEEGADAVFGSRYLTSAYRRVLMYRHTLINKTITGIINWFTDLDLTDVETCYKAVKTTLLKSIPLRSNDFRFEVELTMKLAKRKARIFEVPVRYLPRSYEEGKKIKFKDGILALLAILKFTLVEDLYHRRAYGLKILSNMNQARRFNKWMADCLRPYMGDRVLEIGAGIGTLTNQFIPRDIYVATDTDKHALAFMQSYAIGKPYLKIDKLDACSTEDFKKFGKEFDTILMVNALEHVNDEHKTLKNLYSVLQLGGKVVILVPQYPVLYGSFDQALHHRERYTKEKLISDFKKAGFRIETILEFNRFTVPSWILNGKILKRKRFSLIQLKVLEILMPLIRRVDRFLPWGGLSIIGVGVKESE